MKSYEFFSIGFIVSELICSSDILISVCSLNSMQCQNSQSILEIDVINVSNVP